MNKLLIPPRQIVLLVLVAFSLSIEKVQAQLCQGSLGDPLVNITFGAGSNPGPSLVAATTTYQYVTTDCPGDGYYTVRNNTSVCFGDTWHSLSRDHTGDPNGYFMLVNASFQPSAFYLDTVKGLCTGTTYEFAAWIINVLKQSACNFAGIEPNLTFTIEKTDGTVIQTYSTGNIVQSNSPVWKQYGFYFTTPVGVSDIVLRIFNNSPGGCGNDLALDDITFRPCGPQLTAMIVGSPMETVTFCKGPSKSFTLIGNISSGFNNPSFQWQQSSDGITWTDIPGATNLSLVRDFPSGSAPGIYYFRLSSAEMGNMSSAQCRVASQQLQIKIAANPVPSPGSNSPLCEGKDLLLTATDASTYQWTGVNNFTASGDNVTIPGATPSQSGRYYVTATSSDGCVTIDSVDAIINPNPVATTSFDEVGICEGENIQFLGSGGISYQWIPTTDLSASNIADPIATPKDTVTYSLIVTNQYSCTDTTQVIVNVIQKPKADAGPDKYIISGKSAMLGANVSGQNVDFTWSPAFYMDDPQSLSPVVTPPFDITYLLTVTSNEGCGIAEDSVHIYVYQDVFVPNAFSPNNDGKNDTWLVPALSAYKEYTVSVYNRYGNLVFYTKNVNKPWDGKYKGEPQPTGAYVYFIDLKEEGRILKGSLMIVR